MRRGLEGEDGVRVWVWVVAEELVRVEMEAEEGVGERERRWAVPGVEVREGWEREEVTKVEAGGMCRVLRIWTARSGAEVREARARGMEAWAQAWRRVGMGG